MVPTAVDCIKYSSEDWLALYLEIVLQAGKTMTNRYLRAARGKFDLYR